MLFCLNAENCTPLIIQQNVDGSAYFNQSWETFKVGFGSKKCNYWLGNELLHQLTKDDQYKLRFDLQALDSGQWYWAEYSTFIVDAEATKYRLTVSGYSGNAGDAMNYSNGRQFTTFDNDNDAINVVNCAALRGGGFWHKGCVRAHVNSATGPFDGPGWYHLPSTTKRKRRKTADNPRVAHVSLTDLKHCTINFYDRQDYPQDKRTYCFTQMSNFLFFAPHG